MFFSFIVPVYNTSKYLDQCMESLLCQTGTDFEILLIDDGSTDNSGELCDSYAKQHPDIVRVIHKENEGLLLTRRRGFKEAKGDWFICIDSDDYANTDLLKKVVETINQYHPDMVMYNFKYVNDSGETSKSRLKIKDESIYEGENKQFIYAHRLLTDDINNMWSKALKRDIVDVDTEYSGFGIRNMCEDALQVLAMFTSAQKLVYLDAPLYYYRKGQDSITATRSYESWMSSKSCFLQTEKYLDIWHVSDELRQKFYTHNAEVLSNFLRWLFSQDEKQLPKSYVEILHEVNKHPSFDQCMKLYKKAYAKTPYLKLSVPRIMKCVQKENVQRLKRFFKFEHKLLSKR